MKRILIAILSFSIILSSSFIVFAEDNSPSDNDYKITVEYLNTYEARYSDANNNTYDNKSGLKIGNEYTLTCVNNVSGNARLRLAFNYTSLIEKYMPLIKTATNVWLQVEFSGYVNSGFNDKNGLGQLLGSVEINANPNYLGLYSWSYPGVISFQGATAPYDMADKFKNNSVDWFAFYIDNTIYDIDSVTSRFKINYFTLYVYLQGINGTDAEEFIVISNNIQNVEGAVKDVKTEVEKIQGQLDNIQSDINSGFDEVGGKLNGIQSDINTGLDNVTGAINGVGSDTSGMDSGMAQLGGQLGDLGDVEDQLGGLIMDKVEVPDLILTNDQGSALALLVSCLNLAYVDLKDYQVMFASVMFFGIIGVLLFGRRNL